MQDFLDYLIFLSLLFLALFGLGKLFSGIALIVVCFLCVAVWLWLGFVIAPKIDHYRNMRRIQRGVAAYLRGTTGKR